MCRCVSYYDPAEGSSASFIMTSYICRYICMLLPCRYGWIRVSLLSKILPDRYWGCASGDFCDQNDCVGKCVASWCCGVSNRRNAGD